MAQSTLVDMTGHKSGRLTVVRRAPQRARYGKKAAWSDVIEMKNPDCNDEQLHASWAAAIAEVAEEGDEDKLDSQGWWTVKEQVVSDIGVF